jgi:pimeloyl-ACP methyl ester carboxylesterase
MYLEHRLVGEGFRVIAPDLASYGESGGLSGPFSLQRHAEDVSALLEELATENVVSVGFAFGAAVLLSLIDYSRIGGIVAIGIPSAGGAPYDKMRMAMLKDWPQFAHRSARAICATGQSDASLQWLGGVFGATPLSSALAGVDVLATFEPLEVDQRWAVPSLFVHGTEDAIVKSDVSAMCVDHFENAELRLVADSGHFVPWDQPAALGDIVSSFAREIHAH